jgi:hypothetical protein
MYENKKKTDMNLISGYLGIASLVGMASYLLIQHSHVNNNIQEGHINPAQVRMYSQDLNNDGKYETVMKIDTTYYLLRQIEGKPVISEYIIKPAEVIMK